MIGVISRKIDSLANKGHRESTLSEKWAGSVRTGFTVGQLMLKAAVGVALLPVRVAQDVVTMGGALDDNDEPHTLEELKRITRHLDDAVE